MSTSIIITHEPSAGCSAPIIGGMEEFIRYTVKDGDTVESIAVKFNTMSDIIHEANCMTAGTSIGPGQVLLVPQQ